MSRARRLRRMDSSFTSVPNIADYTSTRVRWVTRSFIAITVILFFGAIGVIARGSSAQTPQARYERFAQIVAGDWLAGRSLSVPAVTGIASGGPGTPFSSLNATTSTTNPGAVPSLNPGAIANTTVTLPPAASASSSSGGSGTSGSVRPAIDVISSGFWKFEVVSNGKQPYAETDNFLVQTPTGYYDLAISVVDADGVPLLAGLPTLAPTGFPGRPNVQQALPSGWVVSHLSSGETNQIDQWAQAYVTGNGQTLYELSGDARATHYAGLSGGWVLHGHPAVTASWGNALADTAVARVQLTVTLGAQTFGMSYDLLIGDVAHRDMPPIEAWGPTGAGFTLKPYANAIAGATGGSQ